MCVLVTDVDIITKFAQMEFKLGEAERGKTMFENILSTYPKRTDLWSVYIDMVTKLGELDTSRYGFGAIELVCASNLVKYLEVYTLYTSLRNMCNTLKFIIIYLKMITAVSILTLKVLIMQALVKECSVFRINRCSTTLLPQNVLKIVYIRVYISICVDIIK